MWFICDKKQKQTLTSGMCARRLSLTTPKQRQINKLQIPKRAQVPQPKTTKRFFSQDAALFVNICQFLDSMKMNRESRDQETHCCQETFQQMLERRDEARDRNLLTGSPHNTMQKYPEGLLCRCHIFCLTLAASFKIYTV